MKSEDTTNEAFNNVLVELLNSYSCCVHNLVKIADREIAVGNRYLRNHTAFFRDKVFFVPIGEYGWMVQLTHTDKTTEAAIFYPVEEDYAYVCVTTLSPIRHHKLQTFSFPVELGDKAVFPILSLSISDNKTGETTTQDFTSLSLEEMEVLKQGAEILSEILIPKQDTEPTQ